MVEKLWYPKYKDFGKEIVDSADIESMDIVMARVGLEEEGELDLEDGTSRDLSNRELRMVALEDRLRLGIGFTAKMFGIVVKISPDVPSDPTGRTPGTDGGDLPEDHEPRNPADSSSGGTLALVESS